MTVVRVLMAWLLLAALPLQGYAAAAMLYCGPGGAHSALGTHHGLSGPATDAITLEHVQHAVVGEHGAHAGSSDHPHHSQQAGQSHGPALDADDLAAIAGMTDQDHACSVCVACSHSMALTGTPEVVSGPAASRGAAMQDPGPFPTRPAPVPDKPPRA